MFSTKTVMSPSLRFQAVPPRPHRRLVSIAPATWQKRHFPVAKAREAADRIQADAIEASAQELMRAQRELRSEAAALAVELAAQILNEQVGDADRERLLDEFISRVEPHSDNQEAGA